MTAKATDPVRHLQQLDELINRVVREAELIHDYVQLRFHGGLVLTLNNAVELDGQTLANSPGGSHRCSRRIIGRTRQRRRACRRSDRCEFPRQLRR